MILNLIFNNPIIGDDILSIKYPDVDYFFFKRIIDYKNDKDIIEILENKLKDLDCRKEYNKIRLLSIKYPIYHDRLSNYYYYLIKLKNQLLYNKYINKLINIHINNIIFEYNNPIVILKKVNNKKKNKPKKFIRQVTTDLITGKRIYLYINTKTQEILKSDNPDLLNELNKPKKKTIKKSNISINNMTFDFKTKN